MRRLLCMAATAAGCVSASTHALIDESFRATRVPVTIARPPPPANDDRMLEGPVTRVTLVGLVLARDPGLGARALRVRAMLHAARAEGALPPPEANVQVWNLPLARPYALGEADMYMLEIRQALPDAGVLDARARAATEEARAMLAEIASREQDLARRTAEAYADYLRGTLHYRIHLAQLRLLGEMRDAIEARYVAGGSALPDVARLEVELAREHRALARIEGEMARARATLNVLLQRPADALLGPPADGAAESVHLSLDELLARAARARASLVQSRGQILAARARVEAARAEATRPVFTVALSYWQNPRERPGVGTMVSMSLPWVWDGLRARLAEAEAREAAARAEARAVDVEVRGEVAAARARLAALERELQVLQTESRVAARRAIDAARAQYVAGQSDLLAWIDAARTVLDVLIEEADLTADLARATAELEQAVGAPLPRTRVGLDAEGGR